MDSEAAWSAIIGGAVGSLLIGVGWLLARLSVVRRELRRNTEVVATINRQLEVWTILEHDRLRQRISSKNADLAGRGLSSSGAALVEPRRLKEESLAAFAERWLDARRELAEVVAAERWIHDLARWVRRTPLHLTAVEDVKPILDHWRAPVRAGGGTSEVADPLTLRAVDAVARQ